MMNMNILAVVTPPSNYHPLAICLFLLSSNSIHKHFDNNQSTYLCKQLNDSISNSYISSFVTLNAPLMALERDHTYWIHYQNEQVDQKTSRLNAVVHPTSLWQSNWQKSGILVLTSYLLLICF